MYYFYYSEKQAAHYHQINDCGGHYNCNGRRYLMKINYVFDGQKYIPFTMQQDEVVGPNFGWADYVLIFQSENPQTKHSQENW